MTLASDAFGALLHAALWTAAAYEEDNSAYERHVASALRRLARRKNLCFEDIQRAMADAEDPRKGYDVQVSHAQMQLCLGRLWLRLGIKPEVLTGTGEEYADAFFAQVSGAPFEFRGPVTALMRKAKVHERSRTRWLQESAFLFFCEAFERWRAARSWARTSQTRLHDLEELRQRVTLRAPSRDSTADRGALATLRLALEALRGGAAEPGVTVEDVDALVLIGAALNAIAETRRCAFTVCFRWSLPGHDHCPQHSRSTEVPGTLQVRAKRYQRGLRVERVYGVPSDTPPERWGDGPACRDRWRELLAREFGRGTPRREDRAALDNLFAQAKRLPRLWHQLPADTNVRNVIERLRTAIDPLEVSLERWPRKLQAADRWIDLEVVACPGRRGSGQATLQRLAQWACLTPRCLDAREAERELGVYRQGINRPLMRLMTMPKANQNRSLILASHGFGWPRTAWRSAETDRAKRSRHTRR